MRKSKEKEKNAESFEERLKKLESISEKIREKDIGIEDALLSFEEGIKLAKELESELEKIEGKVQILLNSPLEELEAGKKGAKAELDLFAQTDAPEEGLRIHG